MFFVSLVLQGVCVSGLYRWGCKHLTDLSSCRETVDAMAASQSPAPDRLGAGNAGARQVCLAQGDVFIEHV